MTGGSLTALRLTFLRRKGIRIGTSSTAIIRSMRRTSGSGWVKRVRSLSGFGISRLVGDSYLVHLWHSLLGGMMVTPAEVSASITALSAPLKDLYESGKHQFKDKLSKWNNSRNIKSLASKVSAYEQIKTIWQREKKVKLSSFYYPSKIAFQTGITKQISSLKDLPSTGGLVIQGTVGQGKSVFLRYLCIKELSSQASGRIPVLVELRKLEPEFPLNKALYSALETLGFEVSDELFDYYAESGKLVVLLDGFDEIEEKLVNGVITRLELWSQKYPQMQFIITSRPGGEIQKSSFFNVLTLASLTSDDHRPFLAKIGVKGKELDALMSAIEKSPVEIQGFLTTPLLLTLLVLVYQSERVIPNELSEFFQLLFTTVFTRHDRSKPAFNRKHKSNLNERKLEKLFEAFCYSILRRRYSLVLKPDQFEESFTDAIKFSGEQCELEGFRHDIVKVACLLQEDGLYTTFVHKSLLDYFPAAFIKNCTDEQSKKIYDAIRLHWKMWRQVLQFLSQIDRYRFSIYFAIPTIEQLLSEIGVTDNNIATGTVDRLIEMLLTNETCFGFVLNKETGKYQNRGFGPYHEIESYFIPYGILSPFNIWPPHMELDQITGRFTVKEVNGEQHFEVYWKDVVKPDQFDELKKRITNNLSNLIDELAEHRAYVEQENEKANWLASF